MFVFRAGALCVTRRTGAGDVADLVTTRSFEATEVQARGLHDVDVNYIHSVAAHLDDGLVIG